jgi:hypothetical protein
MHPVSGFRIDTERKKRENAELVSGKTDGKRKYLFFMSEYNFLALNRRIYLQQGYTNTQGSKWEVSFAQGNVTDAQ